MAKQYSPPCLSPPLWSEKIARDREKGSYFEKMFLEPLPEPSTWQLFRWWVAEIFWRVRDAWLVLAGRAHACVEDDE